MSPCAGQAVQVLIVEDCADTANSLATLVRIWGHQPRIAPDGAKALTAVAERCPDVVLLDVGLPDGDGLALIPRLRRLSAAWQAVIAVVSGFDRPDDRRRAYEAGADAFLVKPVDPEVIRRLLAGRQRKGTGNDGRTADGVREQPEGGG